MKKTFKFGLLYFMIIFFVGFILGVVRNVFLLPLVGPLLAVFMEIPFMLLASYFVAKKLLRIFRLSSKESLAAGLLAFYFLMAAEYSTYVVFIANDFAKYINEILTPQGLVGFSAQILFSFIPYFIVARE